MKVRIEIDETLTDIEIVLRGSKDGPEIHQLAKEIEQDHLTPVGLVFYQADKEFYFDPKLILFFETDGRDVYAHTQTESFMVNYRLYEIEESLGFKFMRISKATIVNLQQVYTITRNVTGAKIGFQDTYKEVYVSRRYYKVLKENIEEVRKL